MNQALGVQPKLAAIWDLAASLLSNSRALITSSHEVPVKNNLFSAVKNSDVTVISTGEEERGDKSVLRRV